MNNNNDNKKTSLFVNSSYFVFVSLCFSFFIIIFFCYCLFVYCFSLFFTDCIKTCAVMIPLLGVTWLFGIFSTFHKAFAYIFTIFSATQVNHCYILRDTISELFK